MVQIDWKTNIPWKCISLAVRCESSGSTKMQVWALNCAKTFLLCWSNRRASRLNRTTRGKCRRPNKPQRRGPLRTIEFVDRLGLWSKRWTESAFWPREDQARPRHFQNARTQAWLCPQSPRAWWVRRHLRLSRSISSWTWNSLWSRDTIRSRFRYFVLCGNCLLRICFLCQTKM